ncbi:condensation domain-containing protein [Streptomyces sp. NPDC019531]|uniref:condensation domain-containing protein n=1 Tax=Streptomyces sp. NPDC019531 TaxID=3365062 RepID=UPI0038508F17
MSDSDMTELPLAGGQERIWLGQLRNPDSPAYNIGVYIDLRGPLDPEVLKQAAKQVLVEAETLRTRIVEVGGELRQRVEPAESWEVPRIDVSGEADPERAAAAWIAAEMARPRAWGLPPHHASALLALAPDRHWLFASTHHLVSDAFGAAILVRRVAQVYTALLEGRDPAVGALPGLSALLDEEAEYRASAQYQEDRSYWRDRLAGELRPVSLSNRTDPAAPAMRRDTVRLDPGVMEGMEKSSKRVRASWPRSFTTAVALYVHGVTGEKDVVLGLPVSVRPTPLSQAVPGMRSNIVPLCLRVEPWMSVQELTAHVRQEMRAALEHQRYRHEELRADLGILDNGGRMNGPVVNIMPFDYDLRFGQTRGLMRNLSNGPVTDIDFICYGTPQDPEGVRFDLDANPDRYTQEEFDGHLAGFLRLLDTLYGPSGDAPAPDRTVADVLMSAAPDAERIRTVPEGQVLAVERAVQWLGTPYSWGGGTPEGPSTGYCDGTNGYGPDGECAAAVTVGFDCSSLVQYAYWPLVQLPRVSAEQYVATSQRPVERQALQPGDLVFWHNGDRVYHVAVYAGGGEVIHAPRTGKNIVRVPLDEAMPTEHYHGATRPLHALSGDAR